MKRLFLLFFVQVIIVIACSTNTEVMPADPATAEAEVTKVLDTHWSAVKSKDAEGVIALLTDDALCCGSDSREFWNKSDMQNNIKQMFADTSFKIDITIDKRIIRVAKDGRSAIALEQMYLRPVSEKIPVRSVYHLVNTNGTWKFDFTSVSFIPDNEHIGRINEALE